VPPKLTSKSFFCGGLIPVYAPVRPPMFKREFVPW